MKSNNPKLLLSLALSLVLALFLNTGMTALAAPVKVGDSGVFDAEYYAENNPDVVAVVGSDFDALWAHYTMYGLYEGRLPFAPDTDWQAVLASGTTVQPTTNTTTSGTVTQSATTSATQSTTSSNKATTQSSVTSNTTTSTNTSGNYIGNINNKKLHKTTCSTLPAEKNQKKFSTLDEAKTAGYTKDKQCKRCYPYGK